MPAIYQKPAPPIRNGKYLAWIRSQPCLICERKGIEQQSETNAHHYGPRAYSTKVGDDRVLPLCHVEHHQYGPESVHVLGKRFAEHHGLDVEHEIATLQAQYDLHSAHAT